MLSARQKTRYHNGRLSNHNIYHLHRYPHSVYTEPFSSQNTPTDMELVVKDDVLSFSHSK